jgi:ADP-ribose pyrophosphatase YjhB (NUDIX family)
MREHLPVRPAVTVATIVERAGAFLLVEEETPRGLKLNQPAGHLEWGESLVAAAVRETLEETAWRIEPVALVGVYRWEAPDNGATFIRFAFAAKALGPVAGRSLDAGIPGDLRSPLVLRCLDDYRAGRRIALDHVQDVA